MFFFSRRRLDHLQSPTSHVLSIGQKAELMHRQTLLPPALCVPETEVATGAKSGSPIPLFCARRDTCRSFLDPARVPKGGLEFDFHPSPSIPQLPTKGHEHSVESTSPSYPHPSPSPVPPLHSPIPRKNRRFHSYKQNARPKRHGHLGPRSAPCLGDRSSRVRLLGSMPAESPKHRNLLHFQHL